jgi:hypothetical protein
MTYQTYSDFYPMADELVHYFEQMLEGDVQVSASQVAKLINFGAQFGIGSHQYWDFCLEKLESKMKELDAPKAIRVINTLKDVGLLTQTLSFGMTDHLLNSKSLSAENLSILLIIAQSDDIDYIYRSMGKFDKLSKGIQSIEKQLIKSIKDVNEEVFGRVCYSLDEEVMMESLLKKVKIDVSKLSLDDLPHVMRAYHQVGNMEMKNSLETVAKNKFLSLTPNQCANIMVQCG